MVKKASSKPSKQALPGSRGNVFLNLVSDLYLEERKGHKYYEPSAHYRPTEAEIEWAAENGIGQALKVAVVDDRLTVTDGRKRYRIAQGADKLRKDRGFPPLRVKCEPAGGQQLQVTRWSAVLNNHRHEDEITQAYRAFQLRELGATDEEIMRDHGWTSTRTVVNRLKLLNLVDEIQAAVAAGELKVSKAMTWTGLSQVDQRAAFKRWKAGEDKPAKPAMRRPTPRKLAQALERLPDSPKNAKLRAMVRFMLGEIPAEDVDPALAKALAPKQESEEAATAEESAA